MEYPFTPPEHGSVIKIFEGIFWVRIPMTGGLDHINCYVLEDGESWTIVDTGVQTEPTKVIWLELLSGIFANKPVGKIIATHHHPDHIGLAGWFMREHGAELLTTRTAWLFARMLQLDHWKVPPAESVLFYQRAGYGEAQMKAYQNRAPFNFSVTVAAMPLGFTRLQDTDKIRIGKRTWQVITGDGHAPEHACLYCEADKILLAGDQLLPRISPNLGVYPTEPDANPVEEWQYSSEKLKDAIDADAVVLPGHGDVFTGAHDRLDLVHRRTEQRLTRLISHLDTPKTAVECFPVLYRRMIDASNEGLATVEAIAHLNCLMQRCAIRRVLRDKHYYYEAIT